MIHVSGAGCALVDYLFQGISFDAPAFEKLRSQKRGDGGLEPGRLVFAEDFEKFVKVPHQSALETLTGKRPPDGVNVGGPAVVAMVLVSQLLSPKIGRASFYGVTGKDSAGEHIRALLNKTPLDTTHYETRDKPTPFTLVLSDPNYQEGLGERAFINHIGAAWDYGPEDLPASFFDGDIALFGATGLTPRLHDNLTALTAKARNRGCLTVVATVFDFRNEQNNPGKQWPLGEEEGAYPHVDLLVMDKEEGLRLSGKADRKAALEWFRQQGCHGAVVTDGAEPVLFYSDGAVFPSIEEGCLPVSREVRNRLASAECVPGDTTGCGDNFLGGVLASLSLQLSEQRQKPARLDQAVATGICAGGSACFQLGGVCLETEKGEARQRINSLYESYRGQVKDLFTLAPQHFPD